MKVCEHLFSLDTSGELKTLACVSDAFILCAGTSKRWIDIYTGVIYSDSKMEKSLTINDAHDDWVHSLEFDGQ